MTLSSNSVNEIGKYSVTIRITQISANNDGYERPYDGKMADMTKEFTVIINPCLETLAVGTAIPDMTYVIGSNTM